MLPWLSSPFHTEKFALWLVKRLESIPHDDDICGVFCFSRHFPDVPPVILNMYPLNIYTHMNAVRMCCERDLDPPNILQSFKATFFTLNDISTYSPSVNRMLSDSVTRRDGGCFLRESSLSLGQEGWPSWWFQHKHFLHFLLGTDAVFWAEVSVEQTLLCVQLWYYFPQISCQRHLLPYCCLVM